GANGAAIALRRGQHNDMLCRASVGPNAPELGALLSMEYGLSGESVRTHKALRCDDTERDPRVNREGCRQLGIASVVVMPIVSEQQVLGVFELFSGKPQAFEERDISALHRLSGMVETAVKHAVATQTLPAAEETAYAENQPSSPAAAVETETAPVQSPVGGTLPDVVQTPVSLPLPELKTTTTETKPAPAPKKSLFWSAAMQNPASASRSAEAAVESSVPPTLRNLRKCQACGFPVSQGRAFCVECEERQWRGQRLSQAATGSATPLKVISAPPKAAGTATASAASSPDISTLGSAALTADFSGSHSAPFAGSAVKSRSWFAANKYIIGALLVVAVVIAAVVWLR
ncbi:MAG: GAF domain-containing protein, partial [Candidatus Sulfotelmatobacter sp.]